MTESKTRNMGTVTGIVVLLAIVVALLYYYFVGIWMPTIGIPLLIIGGYEMISAFFRNSELDRWGTSDSGAAVLWGSIMLGIGGAMIVYQYTDSVIFPIIFFILMMILYLVIRGSIRKKE